MPIFGRRQLQRMFEELGPWLLRSKAKDLLTRLENIAPDQALPAEYELAITWAVSRAASLEVDLPMGSRTPDIYSPDLLARGPLVADVAAVDDVSLSGIKTMRRARNIINDVCNGIRKRSSEHLHYTFGQESGYAPSSSGGSRYYRHRLVSRTFGMNGVFRNALKTWLAADRPSQPLFWKADEITVSIQWRDFAHPFANIFCAMPSLALDLRDNPLYRALRAKSRQLREAPSNCLRAIFLGDAGCRLLDDLQPTRRGTDTFSGGQIVLTFLEDYPAIDFVLVFSVKRLHPHSTYTFDNPRVWRSHLFTRDIAFPLEDLTKLNRITEQIPAPYLSGFEAHSWHEQGMCHPNARGHYVGSHMSHGESKTTLRVSARAVQELMAGVLTPGLFRNAVFGNDNPVRQQLLSGRTISNVHFEQKGETHDDDYLVIEFTPDFAAGPLRLPSDLKDDVDPA